MGRGRIGVVGELRLVLDEALSRLPGVAAVIVGDALFTDEDQRYKRELVELAQQLGSADRVHFVGFRVMISHHLSFLTHFIFCRR